VQTDVPMGQWSRRLGRTSNGHKGLGYNGHKGLGYDGHKGPGYNCILIPFWVAQRAMADSCELLQRHSELFLHFTFI